MKPQELFELKIDSLAFEGYGVARKDGVVHFVENALPGDVVIARLKKKKSNYCISKVSEIIKPSDKRRIPICKYFGECGGCSLQNLEYSEQLFWKKRFVIDAFERIGGFSNIKVQDVIPSSKEYFYRNKMEFSFSDKRWRMQSELEKENEEERQNCFLGLHPRNCYFKVIDLEECFLLPPQGIDLLKFVREKANNFRLDGYNSKKNVGFLRNLIIRYSFSQNCFMVILITKMPQDLEEVRFIDILTDEFFSKFNNVVSFVHCINESVNPTNIDEFQVIRGESYLTEKFFDLNFEISPFSFFQTNYFQIENFIKTIVDYAELSDNNRLVWDLFCGTGLISLAVSKYSKQVYGFELYDKAVEDARKNARLNKISNTKFEVLNLQDKNSLKILKDYKKPDVVILDPPRTGIHKNLVNLLCELNVNRIVYVSCNPATQARDCKLLGEKYKVEFIQPVDMFPQTFHIESIAKLCLK